MQTPNKIVYDVISFTFHEEDKLPLGQDTYGTIDTYIQLITESNLQDMIAVQDTQEGISVYIRNTIGLNDNHFISSTDTWKREDTLGQWSQFKTLVLNKIIVPEQLAY